MDFFDELGKKASKTYQYAAEKTGKISRVAKLKMLMSEDKRQVEEIYKQIGRKLYEKHVREEEFSIKDFLEEKCSEIDLISDEIESARMEILALQDKKQCDNCFCEIDIDYQYCPNCGEKQEESKKEAKEQEENRQEEQEIILIEEGKEDSSDEIEKEQTKKEE